MASNLTITYPPAVGAAVPPAVLVPFGNTSASTKASDLNYPSGTSLPTTPVAVSADSREVYLNGQIVWPR